MSSVNLVAPRRTAAGQVVFHLNWIPKKRFKVLQQPRLFEACDASIRRAAARHGMTIIELSVMPDHVHCLVACLPRVSAADAARLLKGASSYDMFRFEPNYRLRYPKGSFWARRYYVRTVGEADLETVRRYVREDNDPWAHYLSQHG
jgi:putative transposase